MGCSDSEHSKAENEEPKSVKRARSEKKSVKEAEEPVSTSFEKTKDGEFFSSLDVKATKNKKRVTVRKFKDVVYVDLREFYEDKEGKMLPGKKGISLSLEQWEVLKKLQPEIDLCIQKV